MAATSGDLVIRGLDHDIRNKWLFHPTAPRAACVQDNGTIVILSGVSQQESIELWSKMELHSTESVVVISWSSSGVLASGCKDGAVLCWDVENGDTCFEGRKHKREVTHVTWNPFVTQQLLSCCWERIVRVWDTDANELCYTVNVGQILIFDIQWISEELFVACNAGDSVHVYDATTGKVIRDWKHQGPVCAMTWNHQTQQLASCSYDTTIKVWCFDVDEDDGDDLWMDLGNGDSAVYCLDWLHVEGGKKVTSLIASGGADQFSVTIWDLRKKYSHQLGEGLFSDFIRDVRFSPDGKMLAAADNYGNVIVWNVAKWTKVVNIEVLPMPPDDDTIDRDPGVRPACYNPLAFRCLDWNSTSDKLIISIDQPEIYVLEFNQNGR